LSTYFSLSRLGREGHGSWVIGTAVPASPEKLATARRARQVTKGPISAGRQWKELSGFDRGQPGRGAGRVVFLSATRFPAIFGSLVSEAGRERGRPKKGRGKSDGFATGHGLSQAGGGKTKEPSGEFVE
jgi:hypothetical protein